MSCYYSFFFFFSLPAPPNPLGDGESSASCALANRFAQKSISWGVGGDTRWEGCLVGRAVGWRGHKFYEQPSLPPAPPTALLNVPIVSFALIGPGNLLKITDLLYGLWARALKSPHSGGINFGTLAARLFRDGILLEELFWRIWFLENIEVL